MNTVSSSYIVSASNNGRQSNSTGAGYRLNIGIPNRKQIFGKRRPEMVTLKLVADNESSRKVNVRIRKCFWNKCPQFRDKGIGRWFIDNGFIDKNGERPWPKWSPPQFRMTLIGLDKFEVRPIK